MSVRVSPSAPESGSEQIRVLYVDDNPSFRSTLAELLEVKHDALTVRTAHSGDAALSAIRDGDIDCVIAEYRLPETTGVALCETVRSTCPDLPFVLVTNPEQESLSTTAFEHGVTDCFRKRSVVRNCPVLVNRIETAVEAYRTRERLDTCERQLAAMTTDTDSASLVVADETVTRAVGTSVFGYDSAELVGESLRGYVHPDDWASVSTAFERGDAASDTEPQRVEHRFRTAQGDWRRVESALHASDAGTVVVTVRDSRTEQSQWGAEIERYETLYGTLPVGVAVLDESAHIEWVNQHFREATGRDETEVTGLQFLELVEDGPVEDEIVERYLDAVRTLLTEDDIEQVKVEFTVEPPHEDGPRVYEGYVGLRPMEDGSFAGTVNAFLDVTERKQRERQLEQYKAAMETVPDGVFLLDENETVTRVNDAWASIVGHEAAELNGESFTELLEKDVVDEAVTEQYTELIETLLSPDNDCQKGTFTTRVTPPDDTEEHVYEVHIGLLPFEEEFQGTAGVVRDITDQVERQEELERENERLDQFAAIVSHDLRNPLQVVDGALELAEETGDPAYFEKCRRATERMERLIDDLLTLAREGETTTAPEPVDLAATARGCWANVETPGVRLRVDTDRTVRADPGRLKQLFENLFRNSVEHTDSAATVTVGDLTDASGFYVEDDGPGIPPEERESVFESGYSTATEGVGFGLSIVEEIARVHGWEVTVCESAEGGARFRFTGVEFPE